MQEKYLDLQRVSATGNSVESFSSANPVFVCVISYTATCEIPGITVAGANPELVKYTSPADSEFLYYGQCRCIDSVPATPDGKPTPAIITRAALQLANIPLLVVEAGTKIKPSIPYVSFGLEPGKNIIDSDAMDLAGVKKAFGHGITMGKELAKASDVVVVGESIPAGTTTTLAVLTALGVDAKFKVSSSMPENPHDLKNRVVSDAMQRARVTFGELKDSPFTAVSILGDPMIPSVAGIAEGVLSTGAKVMLAGGTQMASVLAILKSIGTELRQICIGTTTYVAGDTSSNIAGLVSQVSKQVPVFSVDLHMIESSKPGLQAFARGFVKEGVGAGGASIAAILKSKGSVTGRAIMRAVEREYEESIEKVSQSHL